MIGLIVFLAVVALAVYYYYVWLPSKGVTPPITPPPITPPPATPPPATPKEPPPPLYTPAEQAAIAARIVADSMLVPLEYLSSLSLPGSRGNEIKNNGFSLQLQGDGRLCMINRKLDLITWCAKTDPPGPGPYRAVMQPDGNFVLYNADGRPYWSAKSQGRSPPASQVVVDASGEWLIKNFNGGVIRAMNDRTSTSQWNQFIDN